MKKITEYHTTQLQTIYRKLAHLKKMQEKVLPLLPTELQPFCHVANQEGMRLTLAVASSAWAMRLRYALPELKRQLLKDNITLIEFYVEPAFETLFKK